MKTFSIHKWFGGGGGGVGCVVGGKVCVVLCCKGNSQYIAAFFGSVCGVGTDWSGPSMRLEWKGLSGEFRLTIQVFFTTLGPCARVFNEGCV